MRLGTANKTALCGVIDLPSMRAWAQSAISMLTSFRQTQVTHMCLGTATTQATHTRSSTATTQATHTRLSVAGTWHTSVVLTDVQGTHEERRRACCITNIC